MIVPCKDCLILPLCRNKTIDVIVLDCDLVVDYLHELSKDDKEIEGVGQVLICLRPKIYADHTPKELYIK